MALVASASSTVRNKNLLMILLFAVFTVWFAYDGWKAYPDKNNELVKMAQKWAADRTKSFAPEDLPALEAWKEWRQATPAQRDAMSKIMKERNVEGWHTATDIFVQRCIVAALLAGLFGTIGWFVHCQRRRAVADEQGLSPKPGLVIPWDKITKIDNTRYKKTGIVDLEYVDQTGATRKTKLDDYELERDALIPILNELQERAKNAAFIPPEGQESPAPADKPTEGTATTEEKPKE